MANKNTLTEEAFSKAADLDKVIGFIMENAIKDEKGALHINKASAKMRIRYRITPYDNADKIIGYIEKIIAQKKS